LLDPLEMRLTAEVGVIARETPLEEADLECCREGEMFPSKAVAEEVAISAKRGALQAGEESEIFDIMSSTREP
jgi:hypothetical protein